VADGLHAARSRRRAVRASLDDELRWVGVAGLAVLAGTGSIVSLLTGELASGTGSVQDEHVEVGVLTGSLLAAALAAVLLRDRTHRRLRERDHAAPDR